MRPTLCLHRVFFNASVKRMKYFFLALSFLVPPAFADSCAKFAGGFEAQLSCQGISPHSGIQIAYFSPNQTLILNYDPGHGEPTQTYISDGADHAGDKNNTGDSYTASCTGNVIKIRRIFS